MRLSRGVYRCRHWGSTLRTMAYRGVLQDGVDTFSDQYILYIFDRESQDGGDPFTLPVRQHGQVVWLDRVDRTMGQNNLSDFESLLDRAYQAFLDQEAQGFPEEEAPAAWLHASYCGWCWSPLPPYDFDHMFCAECRRWYDDAYCYWCWDSSGDWYPGWPDYHLALCDRCSRRYLDALGPPWYPNHEQRCHLLVRWLFEVQAPDTAGMPGVLALSRARGTGYELPREVCDHVAVFLAQSWRP